MIRFNCTKCGQHYKTDDDLAGEEVECSKCDTTLQVPNDIIPPAQTSTVESGKTQEVTIPSLSLPGSIKEKIQKDSKTIPPPLSLPKKTLEKTTGETAEACPKCGAVLQSAHAVFCVECGNHIEAEGNAKTIKNAKIVGKLGKTFKKIFGLSKKV